MYFVGILGLLCIAGAWVPQTIETVRSRYCTIGFPFLILYIIGSASLTIHSIIINDMVFLVLNVAATVQSLINLYYRIYPGFTNAENRNRDR